MNKYLEVDDEEKKDGSNHNLAMISASAPIAKTAETKIADGNWVRYHIISSSVLLLIKGC